MGVTLAAGAVVWRGGEVLLIRRGKEPRLGEWSIPGGRLETAETLKQAAVREVLEETACRIEVLALCDVVEVLEGDRHLVLVDFTARWLSGEPVAGDDALEARFVPADAALEMVLWSETRRVIALSRGQMGV
ncbi:MAG: NUDIX hydrolase [Alphaproteobacteria bacterium]|nr:NUDIX hydrolase [Alphaproteobacteria bacterium]